MITFIFVGTNARRETGELSKCPENIRLCVMNAKAFARRNGLEFCLIKIDGKTVYVFDRKKMNLPEYARRRRAAKRKNRNAKIKAEIIKEKPYYKENYAYIYGTVNGIPADFIRNK